jgi:predicted XRE-type DNA-binding protein
MTTTDVPEIEDSSGNVFADLGFEDPEGELARANLAIAVAKIIDERGWTEEEAAAALGLDQQDVSAIVDGRLEDYSIERLMRLLTRLARDVRIVVGSSPELEGRLSVQLPA